MASSGVSNDRYKILVSRYHNFTNNLDEECEAFRVFDPLTKKQLDELDLIRDISVYLQSKKNEDIQAANNAAKITEEEIALETEIAVETEETKEN